MMHTNGSVMSRFVSVLKPPGCYTIHALQSKFFFLLQRLHESVSERKFLTIFSAEATHGTYIIHNKLIDIRLLQVENKVAN